MNNIHESQLSYSASFLGSLDVRKYIIDQKKRIGNTHDYQKNVMQLYSELKSRRRRQRRENILQMRHSTPDTFGDLRSLQHEKKIKVISEIKSCFSAGENKFFPKIYEEPINANSVIDHYFSPRQNSSRAVSTLSDFSIRSTPCGFSMNDSVSSICPKNNFYDNGFEINYKLSSELQSIWDVTRVHLVLAQTFLIRALLPKLAILLKFGVPIKKFSYFRRRRFRTIQAVKLDLCIADAMRNNNNVVKSKSKLIERSIITNIPLWEQRFLGLTSSYTIGHSVICYQEPPADVKSWIQENR